MLAVESGGRDEWREGKGRKGVAKSAGKAWAILWLEPCYGPGRLGPVVRERNSASGRARAKTTDQNQNGTGSMFGGRMAVADADGRRAVRETHAQLAGGTDTIQLV